MLRVTELGLKEERLVPADGKALVQVLVGLFFWFFFWGFSPTLVLCVDSQMIHIVEKGILKNHKKSTVYFNNLSTFR